jgi:DNA-binding winged helix-turn-helix (wHTH) protein
MDELAAADISLFEGFRLDRRGGVLFRRDQQGVFTPIAIGRRALGILGVLVERPGDLVSRDDIIEAVWSGTTVEDSNLNARSQHCAAYSMTGELRVAASRRFPGAAIALSPQ